VKLSMTISEQIKILCVRCNISTAELARRLGKSPQNLNAKMKRESFTIADLEKIANVMNAQFERNFILYSGEKI
jgi:transcriptional regulator with XRE-family HTH domain